MSNNIEIEIYKRKTIESAINTIITKIQDIYGLSEEEKKLARRRWIWELVQNASDCSNQDKVQIKINFDKEKLVFSHNGDIFTYENLIDLITQISSKRIKNTDQIGKFGTGFISTHLISPKVHIKGLYHGDINSSIFKELDIIIDRSNLDEKYIKDSIENSLTKLDELKFKSTSVNPFEKGFNTEFIYYIKDSSQEENIENAIKIGLEDLDKCVGYIFAFSKKIEKVECNSYVYTLESEEKLTDYITKIVVRIQDRNLNQYAIRRIIICSDYNVTIAIEVIEEQENYVCKNILEIPRIFCTFPLIGTEDFPLPVIVNSTKFEISQERNSVHESENNMNIFNIAIKLYDKLLEFVNKSNYKALYNICRINRPFINYSEYKKNIYSEIERIFSEKEIVPCTLYNNEKYKLPYGSGENFLIPYVEENYRDEFWDLFCQLNFKIPIKDEYLWGDIFPNSKVNINYIFNNVLKEGECVENLPIKEDKIKWLNDFYNFCIKNEIKIITLPNQYDCFINIENLQFDNSINNVLKDILLDLKVDDIRKSLINTDIIKEIQNIKTCNNQYVCNKIAEKIREILSKESSGQERSYEIQMIFNKLTDWFVENTHEAKDLFKDIYENKFQLSTRDETIRRLNIAAEVEKVISKNNIEFEQAISIIQESANILNIIDNGEIGLPEDVKNLFKHISSSSIFAKEKIEKMIERSILEIHKELSNNPKYRVPDLLEEWKENQFSTTVFDAKKEGKDIRIIIRPSDDNRVIFYEDAELDALDDTDYELWICDQDCKARMLTLGDILKTTGINLIPLRKI